MSRLVDPSLCWWSSWFWAAMEAFRVSSLRLIEDGLAALEDLMVTTSMQVSRPEVADAAVVVRVAVPVEELPAPCAGTLD